MSQLAHGVRVPERARVDVAALEPVVESRAHVWRGRAIQLVADEVMVVGAVLLARVAAVSSHQVLDGRTLTLCLVSVVVFPSVFVRLRLYETRIVSSGLEELRRVVEGCAMAAIVVTLFAQADEGSHHIRLVAWLAACSALLIESERRCTRRYFRRRRQLGVGRRRTVIVGSGADAEQLVSAMTMDDSLGCEVVAVCSDGPSTPLSTGGVAEVVDVVRGQSASTVVIAQGSVGGATIKALTRELHAMGVHVEVSSGLAGTDAGRVTVSSIGSKPVFYLEPARRHGWRACAKRSLDVVVAATTLVLLAPALALIALIVKLSDGGTVLFQQDRVGRDGRTFRVLKFRTMVPDAEARLAQVMAQNESDGPLFKMKDDPRITPFGRILRRTSLDEVPQLWNVLRGDMSLVGPRPALPSELDGWTAETWHRLAVKPGVTGMWQVHGRSNASFDEYVRLDLYYVENWSLVWDLAILFKTIPAVLSSSGAY